ncbi:hypothetical protein [Nocardia africana]|uniref:Uncharacterized protein n=1 Tax=Nocardia africana TaxID=134964 RepID=A0ABW6NBH3_9NOCA
MSVDRVDADVLDVRARSGTAVSAPGVTAHRYYRAIAVDLADGGINHVTREILPRS